MLWRGKEQLVSLQSQLVPISFHIYSRELAFHELVEVSQRNKRNIVGLGAAEVPKRLVHFLFQCPRMIKIQASSSSTDIDKGHRYRKYHCSKTNRQPSRQNSYSSRLNVTLASTVSLERYQRLGSVDEVIVVQ